MAIARHPVLSNPTHVSHLPGAWGTLYELSRVPERELEAAIEAGEVTATIRREEAKALGQRAEPNDPRLIALHNALAGLHEALRVLESDDSLDPEFALKSLVEVHDLAETAEARARAINGEYAEALNRLGNGPRQSPAASPRPGADEER